MPKPSCSRAQPSTATVHHHEVTRADPTALHVVGHVPEEGHRGAQACRPAAPNERRSRPVPPMSTRKRGSIVAKLRTRANQRVKALARHEPRPRRHEKVVVAKAQANSRTSRSLVHPEGRKREVSTPGGNLDHGTERLGGVAARFALGKRSRADGDLRATQDVAQ